MDSRRLGGILLMKLFCSWNCLKEKFVSGISLYYYESPCQYEVFIIEGNTVWYTEIWKSCTWVDGLDENENTTHLDDFEDNYKSTSHLCN